MAVVRFQVRGCGQVSPNVSATEHILNNGHDFITATVISYVPASHTQGESPGSAGQWESEEKEGNGPFNRKQGNYKANKTAVWKFLQG